MPRPARYLAPLLLALAGCGGTIDENARWEERKAELTPKALSFCADPLGGSASRVVFRWLDEPYWETLTIEKVDRRGNVVAAFEDFGSDGTINSSWSYDWAYDERGEWTWVGSDFDADGTVDSVMTRNFDADGRLQKEATDPEADGLWNIVTAYDYDASGRVVLESTATDGEISLVRTYEYDADGGYTAATDSDPDGQADSMVSHLLVEPGVWEDAADYDGDGTVDWSTRQRFDDQGRLTEEALDDGGDGEFETVVTSHYSNDGQLEARHTDKNADGTIDLAETYAYDANGELLVTEVHSKLGRLLTRSEYSRDAGFLTLTVSNYDNDGARVTSRSVLTTAPDGHEVGSSWDADGDDLDEAWMMAFDCPAAPGGEEPDEPNPADAQLPPEAYCSHPLGGEASRVSVERQRESSGDLVLRVRKFDEHGNVMAGFDDLESDGAFDRGWATELTYGDQGEWTTAQSDRDGDGSIDDVEIHTFDEQGTLTEITIDSNVDGSWDTKLTYSFDDLGRILTSTVIEGAKVSSSVKYVYDDDGGFVVSSAEDGDGDWVPVASYRLADDGSWIYESDADTDGAIEWRTRTTLDDEGRVLETAEDSLADGTYDYVSRHTYSPSGKPSTDSEDQDGNGTIDLTTTYSYGPNDEPTLVETRQADGTLVSQRAYEYDGDTVIQTYTFYDAFGGTYVSSFSKSGDDLVWSSDDHNGDGIPEVWATYVDCP